MSSSPRVVIGVPLYNRAEYLPSALGSLLSQTYRDFALVLIDDCSTDATAEIVQNYLESDIPVTFRVNPQRLGMIENWCGVFRLGRQLYPEAEYFAWGSDHDLWDPHWLAELVSELDRYPDVVLAYPYVVRITAEGEVFRGPFRFQTLGDPSALSRLARTCFRMSAGNMVYGVFRAGVLERASMLRPVLLPDRLLLAESSLYGQFRQVPEVLWQRRFGGLFSFDRQRASFFPNGVPAYARLPWWLLHICSLVRALAVEGSGRPIISRGRGLAYALAYGPLCLGVIQRYNFINFCRAVRKHGLKVFKISHRFVFRRVLRPVAVRVLARLPAIGR